MIDIKKVKEAFEITMGYKPNQDKQLIESGIPFRIVELFPNESETIEQALNELERLQQKETPMRVTHLLPHQCQVVVKCPKCRCMMGIDDLSAYCSSCGQRLDWSEEK